LLITYDLASRAVHDSKHCVADIERARGNFDTAISLYEEIESAGISSGDVNLMSTSILGVAALSISSNKCLGKFYTWSDLEVRLLDVEVESDKLGIKINQLRAKLFRALLPSTSQRLRSSMLTELEPVFRRMNCSQEISLFDSSFPRDLIQLMDIQNV